MARKLPWAVDSVKDTKPSRAVATKPIQLKRERPTTPDEDRIQHRAVHDVRFETPKKQQKRATSRSSSTSPPPGPPEIEVMHEGYDADDAFIMVEDELNTVAQSFTAHLHHAEYKRLLRQAQQAPPKDLPDLSPSMSHEVKQKLRREKLALEQRSVLQSVGATASGSHDAPEEGDMDETRMDDPWTGTSLAGLMAAGSQQKTSLLGLERMPSYTRAARGYEKGPTLNTAEPLSKDVLREADQRLSFAKAGEDNDKRGPKARSNTGSSKIEASVKIVNKEFKNISGGPKNTSKHVSSKDGASYTTGKIGESRPKFAHSFLHDSDDSDGDVPGPPRPLVRSRRPESADKKKEREKRDRKSRFDEVPMFLT